MQWASSFPGVHHLKGGDTRLKVSIQEFQTRPGGVVIMTESGTFIGRRKEAIADSLDELKAIGAQFEKDGFR